MNPFQVPGNEDNPNQPLNPWRFPGHREYYVDVGGMSEAFEIFRRHSYSRKHFTDGGLVIVSGPEGTGKTSLVNRCVQQLSDDCESSESSRRITSILDLRSVRLSTDLGDRIRSVCRLLDRVLESRRIVVSSGENNKDLDWPDEFYAVLADRLPDHVLILVLLPPSGELIDEILHYAHMVNPGIVFMAETTHGETLAARLDSFVLNMPTVPLHLRLKAIDADDAVAFVLKSLASAQPDKFCRVEESGIRRLFEEKSISLRHLRSLMLGIYQEHQNDSSCRRPYDLINYEQIIDYFYRHFNRSVPLSFGSGPPQLAPLPKVANTQAHPAIGTVDHLSLGGIFVHEQYNINQAGAVGPGATSSNSTFISLGATKSEINIDVEALRLELEQLRAAMRQQAATIEEDQAVVEIGQAQLAAAANDQAGLQKHLLNAGKWALNCATTLGTTVAAAAIKSVLGL